MNNQIPTLPQELIDYIFEIEEKLEQAEKKKLCNEFAKSFDEVYYDWRDENRKWFCQLSEGFPDLTLDTYTEKFLNRSGFASEYFDYLNQDPWEYMRCWTRHKRAYSCFCEAKTE